MKYLRKLMFLFILAAQLCAAACALQNPAQHSDGNAEIQNVKYDGFTYKKIPQKIFKKMQGNSYPHNALIPIDELHLLEIKYYGFDWKAHKGEIIAHKKVAAELLDIFEELFEEKYPIEKVRLIDYYNADDEKSMADNNTSAFCWRNATLKKELSYHALGLAVDINPLYNPYVKGNVVEPIQAKKYLDRNKKIKGLISGPQDAAVQAFKKRGWIWGGEWQSLKDYQHFEKRDAEIYNYYNDLAKEK
ncbi:MAG: M15 family metallopeptidase [Elusimicrobiota bacterium]|jgi:hypothetical protein|nr:M15 family metallopeptidase [Elusimicrobiota bacterium]